MNLFTSIQSNMSESIFRKIQLLSNLALTLMILFRSTLKSFIFIDAYRKNFPAMHAIKFECEFLMR